MLLQRAGSLGHSKKSGVSSISRPQRLQWEFSMRTQLCIYLFVGATHNTIREAWVCTVATLCSMHFDVYEILSYHPFSTQTHRRVPLLSHHTRHQKQRDKWNKTPKRASVTSSVLHAHNTIKQSKSKEKKVVLTQRKASDFFLLFLLAFVCVFEVLSFLAVSMTRHFFVCWCYIKPFLVLFSRFVAFCVCLRAQLLPNR